MRWAAQDWMRGRRQGSGLAWGLRQGARGGGGGVSDVASRAGVTEEQRARWWRPHAVGIYVLFPLSPYANFSFADVFLPCNEGLRDSHVRPAPHCRSTIRRPKMCSLTWTTSGAGQSHLLRIISNYIEMTH
jgi:hypothetical protein